MRVFLNITVAVLIAAPSIARADCFDECMSIKNCWHKGQPDSSYCGSAEVNCQRECELKEQGGDVRSYGAIAYSRHDGSYGYSGGQNSRGEAEKLALNYCKQYDRYCRVMVWFYNSCGAVAADGKKTGWGRADSEYEAQQNAIRSCEKSHGKSCQIQVSHCSF